MNINSILTIGILLTLALGSALYYYRDTTPIVVTPVPNEISVVYTDAQYGFKFALPDSWEEYSVVKTVWEGTSSTSGAAVHGPKLLIRNPKWTEAAPYEDLPILVFTHAQWNSYLSEDFYVSAAPLPATELARNNVYVFALPPRWDFDYSLEYKEAQEIMAGNPLQPFDLANTTTSEAKLNINVVCEQALSYMTFANATSADAFVADCKEGKHPEVIEKYKADLNLGAGAAI